jgi:hypothetical protein
MNDLLLLFVAGSVRVHLLLNVVYLCNSVTHVVVVLLTESGRVACIEIVIECLASTQRKKIIITLRLVLLACLLLSSCQLL